MSVSATVPTPLKSWSTAGPAWSALRRGDVGTAIEKAKQRKRTLAEVSIARAGNGVSITVGSGVGSGRLLLIGFDHEHVTAIGRGENSGRTLPESNVVRSIRLVGQWSGAPLKLEERFPEGQDAAVVLEAPDGQIVGASRLPSGGST